MKGAVLSYLSLGDVRKGEIPAMVQPCLGDSPDQHLILSSGGRIQTAASSDLCLASSCTNGGALACYPLYFTPCAPTAQEQLWSYDVATSEFRLKSNATQCLDIASGGKGVQIGLYRCLGDDAGQQWTIESGSGAVRADSCG